MTGTAELTQISSAPHDEWFNLDRVAHDAERGKLRVSLFPARRTRRFVGWTSRPPVEPLPPPIGNLMIRHVADVTINDQAGLGWFDLADLTFEPIAGVVRLRSNFPLEILVQVDELDVDLMRP